MDIRSKL